ncbi:MAG: DNA topoisomerase IB [Burkholderiales bacterium]
MNSDAPPAHLVYVNDESPGICRLRRGKGFTYRRPDGRRLTDAAQLDRIRRLAIPPAYTKVWICPMPHGHLQATGRDARGRKQFRYHADWRRARDEKKFERMLDFAAALPRIRARVRRDLEGGADHPLARDAVIAAIVRLLDTTLMRVGNDEYARANGSFGLTTLRNRHAVVDGAALRLRFRGKSGVEHEVALRDPRVARIVARCQALPGQPLFEYRDAGGTVRGIGSADVNDYLRAASGGEFTAKDFRTWHGSVVALHLCSCPGGAGAEASPAARARRANALLSQVAARLGNTVAVCKQSYVHPRVLDLLANPPAAPPRPPPRKSGLNIGERHLLALLRSPG